MFTSFLSDLLIYDKIIFNRHLIMDEHMNKFATSTIISFVILSTCLASLFCNASSTKHFTNYPVVAGGNVTLFNADTKEVFHTTQTENDGSFSLPKGIEKDIEHEFVSISIKGGTAIVDEPPWTYKKERHPDNEMSAMIRTDSLARGSVTVSAPTTVAYIFAETFRGNVFDSDIIAAHQDNLKQVTRSFRRPVSKWDYETVYLNTEKQEALVDTYSVDYQEFVERIVFGTGGLKIVELMTVEPNLQREGLGGYFKGLNGSWSDDDPTYEPFFTSKPLSVKIYDGDKIRLVRTIFDDNSNKIVLQDEVIQGELMPNQDNFPFSIYKTPKIIVGKKEIIRIESASDEQTPQSWGGCKSFEGVTCRVSDRSMEVSLSLSPPKD